MDPNLSNIGNLLEVAKPIVPLSMLPSDVEVFDCYDTTCLKCKICGGKSGTLQIINHINNCEYGLSRQKLGPSGPYIINDGVDLSLTIPRGYIVVLQREYGEISKESVTPIIGSFGAGPCVILCMRDRTTTKTILAHIDAISENYMDPFFKYDSQTTDVFIVGGDESSDLVYEILVKLHHRSFDIKLAHIVDNAGNNFAINCITGQVCLNDVEELTRTSMSDDDIHRHKMNNFRLMFPGKLSKLVIKE